MHNTYIHMYIYIFTSTYTSTYTYTYHIYIYIQLCVYIYVCVSIIHIQSGIKSTMNHSSCGTTIDYLCLVVVSTLSWSRPEIFRESMGTSQPRLINKGYPWVLSIDSTWLGLLISMRLFLWSRVFCGDVVSKPQSCRLTRVDKFPIFAA